MYNPQPPLEPNTGTWKAIREPKQERPIEGQDKDKETMKIEIKHRHTGDVLFNGDYANTKDAAEAAVKQGANFTGANFTGADLRGADLRGADLRGADLSGADLRGADLRGADLSGAYLRWADLSGAYLRWANITGADLTGADLSGAYITGANIRGANLDFSCWPLWCGSLNVKIDDKQKRQLLYHLLSVAPEYRSKKLLKEANLFHRLPEVPALDMPLSRPSRLRPAGNMRGLCGGEVLR